MIKGLVLTDAFLSAFTKKKNGRVKSHITASDNSGKIYPLDVQQNYHFLSWYVKMNGFNNCRLPSETFPCVCLGELDRPDELYKGALITPPELEKINISMVIPDAKVIGIYKRKNKEREYVLFRSDKFEHQIMLLYGFGDYYGKSGFFNPQKDKIRDFIANKESVYCIKVNEIYQNKNKNYKVLLGGRIVDITKDERIIEENSKSLDSLLDKRKNPDVWWNREEE